MNSVTDSGQIQRHRPNMVSVVIPVRDGAEVLPMQLASMAKQDYEFPWEVVVVDNGSTDGTAEIAMEWQDRLPIRVVSALMKPSVSHARNTGIRQARGELVVFCDADDEVSEGWLNSLVEASLMSDAVGGAIDHSRLNEPEVVSWRPAPMTTEPRTPGDFLPAITSANLAVWTDVLNALGGFNEDYVYGAEDTEFSWRLQLAGYRLGFAPEAIVHYRLRDDVRSLARQFYSYGKGHARLYRDFRSSGMPHSSIRVAAKSWAWLGVHIPDLVRNRTLRAIWIRTAALRLGRATGSVQCLTVYL